MMTLTIRFSLLLLTTSILFFSSCKQDNTLEEGKIIPYTLVNRSGIMVEQFDSTVTDENRYNYDNKVFKVGTKFLYDYTFVSALGDTLLYNLTSTEGDWEFRTPKEADDETIRQFEIGVKNGLKPMIDWYPNYYQTLLSYTYPPQTTYSLTGAIENKANLWIHPPRVAMFKILELNPFPFIKYPLEEGKTWEWTLEVGSSWADVRWKTWEGVISNKSVYTVGKTKTVSTPFGELNCTEIKAVATSELGETRLNMLFHPEKGFIHLDYTNIDRSKLLLKQVKSDE
ncbi:MAG: hypothetical protein AAF740_15315 [Bacteroidota bacterium]